MPLAVVIDDRVDVWEVPSQPHSVQVRAQLSGRFCGTWRCEPVPKPPLQQLTPFAKLDPCTEWLESVQMQC